MKLGSNRHLCRRYPKKKKKKKIFVTSTFPRASTRMARAHFPAKTRAIFPCTHKKKINSLLADFEFQNLELLRRLSNERSMKNETVFGGFVLGLDCSKQSYQETISQHNYKPQTQKSLCLFLLPKSEWLKQGFLPKPSTIHSEQSDEHQPEIDLD